MHVRLRDKGFSLVLVLLGIVVIVGIGFGGWFVRQHTHKKQTSTASVATSPPAGSSQVSGGTPGSTVDSSEGGNYLVIKEWGIRFLLPEDLRGDVSYGIRTDSDSGLAIASFEVGKIAHLADSDCALFKSPDGISGGIGVMLSRKPEKISAQERRAYASELQLEDHWYYVTPQKGSCLASDTNRQQEGDAAQTLTNALATLQIVK